MYSLLAQMALKAKIKVSVGLVPFRDSKRKSILCFPPTLWGWPEILVFLGLQT